MKLKLCTKCKKRKLATAKFFDYRTRQHLSFSSWCKACSHARTLAWRQRNPDYQRQRTRYYYQQAKKETLTHYCGGRSPRCACCGETNLSFLGIDHINGGGIKHRAVLRLQNIVGGGIYRWLRDQGWPPGYRVLCNNCNIAIGFYGVCPHKKPIEIIPPDVLRGRCVSLARKGIAHPDAKLTPRRVLIARESVKKGIPIVVLARRYGISPQAMRKAVIGGSWAYLPGAIGN
jgi:hypothetical protein